MDRSDDVDVVMMVNKLPQPLPGQRYELYVTSNGRTMGMLKLGAAGFALVLFRGRCIRQAQSATERGGWPAAPALGFACTGVLGNEPVMRPNCRSAPPASMLVLAPDCWLPKRGPAQ